MDQVRILCKNESLEKMFQGKITLTRYGREFPIVPGRVEVFDALEDLNWSK